MTEAYSESDFYPRPPRGGRQLDEFIRECKAKFLPTPSARRATIPASDTPYYKPISTHALREEGDGRQQEKVHYLKFLPTPSARRATDLTLSPPIYSPHFYPRPPRGGRRWNTSTGAGADGDFYPRPPRGGRLPTISCISDNRNFYPRPPRGGRPFDIIVIVIQLHISTHALREEGDFDG